MAQLSHDLVPEFQAQLEKYIVWDARYIIAKEVAKGAHKETNGEHIHVAVDMTKKEYDAFRNTVLVKKYNLRGKAEKDLPRQYGIVKNVRNEMKMLSYTVKSKNIIYRNIDLETIQDYIEKSFEKTDNKKDFQQDLMYYLRGLSSSYIVDTPRTQNKLVNGVMTTTNVQEINFKGIQSDILRYWVLNASKPLSRCQLQFYTNLYLQFHFPQFEDFIFDILGFLNGKI